MNLEEREEWKIFTHNIAWLRKQAGLSKKDMAKILEIGTESLNKLEKGQCPKRLGAKIFINVHQNFGIRPSDQLGKRLGE